MWGSATAAVKRLGSVECVTWSPCSRFIAIEFRESRRGARRAIEILDAVTLNTLQVLRPPPGYTQLFAFSAESSLLTQFSGGPGPGGVFTSWDIQTGIPVSVISLVTPGRGEPGMPIGQNFRMEIHADLESRETPAKVLSITHSGCGTMFGVLLRVGDTAIINTYNIPSGTLIYSRRINKLVIDIVWTQGECLQYAFLERTSIAVWEARFASTDASTRSETLPIPEEFDPSEEFIFHPAPFRLAFILKGNVLVWDTQRSKFLLRSGDAKTPRNMTFSLNGGFFACGTNGPDICLWRESSDEYIFHEKHLSNARERAMLCKPRFSPDGQSIIATFDSTLQLWPTFSPANSIVIEPDSNETFIMDISPDRSWAAAARLADKKTIALNISSSLARRLIIKTGMKIYGLKVDCSSVTAIGHGRVITWSLPSPQDRIFSDDEVGVDESVRTTTFDPSPFLGVPVTPSAAMSPDLKRLVVMGEDVGGEIGLNLYDVSTGQRLAGIPLGNAWRLPFFTSDGREIWCDAFHGREMGWAIVEDSESGHPTLEPLDSRQHQRGTPWRPTRDYRMTDDGWILSASGKRMLWLPPHLQSDGINVGWGGQYLGLLHSELEQAIVLGFPDE